MAHTNVVYLDTDSSTMFKAIAIAALAALMGADAFVSPVATSFSGSAVAQKVRPFMYVPSAFWSC